MLPSSNNTHGEEFYKTTVAQFANTSLAPDPNAEFESEIGRQLLARQFVLSIIYIKRRVARNIAIYAT